MTSLPSAPNGSVHTPIAAIRHAWSGVRAATTSTAAQGTPPLVSRRNYTGQILDATGLLFYNARYYDPGIGRFLSADTVVPGAPSGTMNGVAVTPLTVDFHESGFRSKLNSESNAPFWFQMDSDARQQHGSPMGPANPQALNRYAYVQNNPLKYTDPSGHVIYLSHQMANDVIKILERAVADTGFLTGFIDAALAGGAPAALLYLDKFYPGLAAAMSNPTGAVVVSVLIALATGLGVFTAERLEQIRRAIEDHNGPQGVGLRYRMGSGALGFADDILVMNRDTGATTSIGMPLFFRLFIPQALWVAAPYGDDPNNGNCVFSTNQQIVECR